MIHGRDIVVIGIQAWDIEIGSNCKNIAEEMARFNRVLYVNSPLDRNTKKNAKSDERIAKRIQISKGLQTDIEEIKPNMWNLFPRHQVESINFIPDGFLYDFFNKQRNKTFAKDIQSAIDRLNFKNVILFNDSSMFLGLYLKEFLKPSTYVYYMRDFLTKNPYWRTHGLRLEPKLIAKADVVVNNSTLYTEYGLQFNAHSYMVGQGCDVSLFNDDLNTISIAEDLKAIPNPIIGYVGFLSGRRLDINLLATMAKARKDWQIVLVGPEDEQFKNSELHQISNIHFLGSRDTSLLPNYIKGFDVCMNPQLINDATIGNYPRKIDEYLAMGKPTVATATKAMDYFKETTYLAITPNEWISAVEKALAEDSQQLQRQRKACGLSHSWENNVNEIYKYIVAFEKG
jgi:glycosyltransferase involved in cell wall biosynthesis